MSTNIQPKFKVGDKIVDKKHEDEKRTIIHVVFEDKMIKAPWNNGASEYWVSAGCYVVLNERGNAFWDYCERFHEVYRLLESSDVVSVASDKYPHTCEYCGFPCWNGMEFECSNSECVTKEN